VADVPRRLVVGHRARPGQGHRLAAEAVARADGEAAQRTGRGAVQLGDAQLLLPAVGEQAAERDG
jgi:hypothetical protein